LINESYPGGNTRPLLKHKLTSALERLLFDLSQRDAIKEGL
jgi:hypothetical protein